MWDAKVSCEHRAAQQLIGVGKDVSFTKQLISSIPSIYYPEISDKIILEKTRTWVQGDNLAMARQYISEDIKSIVMVRPVDEIVASFARVSLENNLDFSYDALLRRDSEFHRALQSTYYAAKSKDSSLVFVSYDELVLEPEVALGKIYRHIGANPFAHNLRVVTQTVFEDDERNNQVGMHDVRPDISKQENKIILPDDVKAQCDMLTIELFDEIRAFEDGLFDIAAE